MGIGGLSRERSLDDALITLVAAARPMAQLPYPMSYDERLQWLTHQRQLIEAIDDFDEIAAATVSSRCPPTGDGCAD